MNPNNMSTGLMNESPYHCLTHVFLQPPKNKKTSGWVVFPVAKKLSVWQKFLIFSGFAATFIGLRSDVLSSTDPPLDHTLYGGDAYSSQPGCF